MLHYCDNESFYTFISQVLFTFSNILLIFLNFNGLKQRYSRQSHRKTSNDGFHALSGNVRNNWSTYPRYFLMKNQNQQRNIDPQKAKAEKLNGRFALVGLIALVGAYITTGQIVPGII